MNLRKELDALNGIIIRILEIDAAIVNHPDLSEDSIEELSTDMAVVKHRIRDRILKLTRLQRNLSTVPMRRAFTWEQICTDT